MISRAVQRPRARLDLLEQFVYLGEQAGVELAERYLEAVVRTCATLSRQPGAGSPSIPASGAWKACAGFA
jgi:plasmid stabilization system protein ParE